MKKNGRVFFLFILAANLFALGVYAKDILTLEKVPGSKIQKITIEGQIDGSVDEIWNILTSFQDYPQFMPKITSTKILAETATTKTYYAHLNMPWFVGDIEYQCEAQLEKETNTIRFALIPGTGKGVKSFSGVWQLIPQNQQTLLTYTLFFEPSQHYPAWIVNNGAKSTAGKTVSAVRQRLKKLRNLNSK